VIVMISRSGIGRLHGRDPVKRIVPASPIMNALDQLVLFGGFAEAWSRSPV
jgi:hypothetical protein